MGVGETLGVAKQRGKQNDASQPISASLGLLAAQTQALSSAFSAY